MEKIKKYCNELQGNYSIINSNEKYDKEITNILQGITRNNK